MTRRGWRALAAAIALLVLLPGVAVAQQPEIVARATLDRTDATLGARVRVTVTVQHPDNVLVDIAPPEAGTAFRVVEDPPPRTAPGTRGGPSVTQFEFVIAAFGLGAQQLPPLVVSWIDESGVSGELTVAVPPFTVASTLDPGDRELRPLKPQLTVEGAPFAWRLPAAIAAGVAVFAIAAIAVLMRRRGPAPVLAPPPEAALSIEDAARQRLETMALARPLTQGDYDAYYGTISLVVRGYLQERFRFHATALTTPELERRMTREGVERWQARLVGGLLDRCDAAVYAGRRPDPASADHDLTVAFEIIELSRPQDEPEPAAAGAAR